jgi:L-fuculose-phosphate aldolase
MSGPLPQTSELRMHAAIYHQVPAAGAVVHCHPPCATAFSMAGQAIPTGVMAEAEIALGQVPTVGFQLPGTEDFAEALVPHLASRTQVFVLQSHGTVAWAHTPERALWLTEILENLCRNVLIARQLGGERPLPSQHLQALAAMREQFTAKDMW